jgi:hypothetical protein
LSGDAPLVLVAITEEIYVLLLSVITRPPQVVFEDTLFLLECKHSLLPVSAFDLRTTHDYIRKAETQLDHLLELHRTGQLGQVLWNRCQLDPNRPWRLVPGIVLGNRMFNGNAFRYPVRNVHEISNFVQNGTLRTKYGLFCLWQSNSLSANDLIDYFSLKNKLVSLQHDSLSEANVTYTVSGFSLKKERYHLNIQARAHLLTAYTNTLVRLPYEPLPI